jgi:hypothetical protein
MVFKFNAGIVASLLECRELRLDSRIQPKGKHAKVADSGCLPYRNGGALLDGDAPGYRVSAFDHNTLYVSCRNLE